ncbi:Ig-like domain-containing protein [Mycobacterium sp. 852014-52144_SCH5372336]|uniref:Ig-like domain-containing protein n=1 Tax=Mycobacterium sp. 852014-52144_SCH5372336 TaxID=1834115 RepID=UPI000A63F9F5|nr:Ig-like domain-containing protein [Mycobacterium sp. 852014-52144_SCH5372336]
MALAVARRELGTLEAAKIANPPEYMQTTEQLVPAAAISAAANAQPTVVRTTVGTPAFSTGVVKGSVTVKDPDNDPLTYTVDSLSAKGGQVTIDQKGKFVYTPTSEMRHAAAVVGADKTDSFTITVDDGQGNDVLVPITVQIRPQNAKPTAPGAAVGIANPNTGVITGTVFASDADFDNLTLTGPLTTKKGTITYDDQTDSFVYTPTAAAFAAANAPKASAAAKTDKFTVILNDGHGGTVTKVVTVNLASVNQTEFSGVTIGPMITDSTGTKYQTMLATDRFGRNIGTKVVIINADGTSTSTATIAGVPQGEEALLSVAPDGGVYLATRRGNNVQVSVIGPTGAVTSSKAVVGAMGGPITVAADGTGYVTVGKMGAAPAARRYPSSP